MADEVVVLFLEVGGRSFAAEVGQVETLRRQQTLYFVHGGPPELLGFLAEGGGALPVVDLGVCLGLPTPRDRGRDLLIVSAVESAWLAFRVDRLEGPIGVAWADLALLPPLLQEMQPRPLVWGLLRRGDELVPLLDLAQVVPADRVSLLLELARTVVRG